MFNNRVILNSLFALGFLISGVDTGALAAKKAIGGLDSDEYAFDACAKVNRIKSNSPFKNLKGFLHKDSHKERKIEDETKTLKKSVISLKNIIHQTKEAATDPSFDIDDDCMEAIKELEMRITELKLNLNMRVSVNRNYIPLKLDIFGSSPY